MEVFVAALIAFFQAHYLVLALILSEILPLIPGVEANSIGQLVINGLKALLAPKQPPVA